MSDEILLREGRLKKLDKGEVRLLFWLCKGKELDELAPKSKQKYTDEELKKFKFKVVRKTLRGRLTKIYEKTELTNLPFENRRPTLIKEYRPIVERVLPEEEDIDLWIEGVGIEGRFTEPEEEETEEPIPVGKDSPFAKPPKKPEPKEPDETERLIRLAKEQQRRAAEDRRRTRRVISILVGGLVIAIVCIIIMWFSRGCGVTPPPPTYEAPTPRLPTRIPTKPKVEQVVPPTDTAIPVTPIITPTSGPIPTPVGLLFYDDFEDGLDLDYWNIVSGDMFTSSGQLVTLEQRYAIATTGKKSWENYQIEFTGQTGVCEVSDQAQAIAVRVQDEFNMVVFHWNDCEYEWFMVDDGEWTKMASGHRGLAGPYWEPHSYRLVVNGSRYSAYWDEELIADFSDTKNRYTNGGLRIYLYNDGKMDELIVRKYEE